MSHRGFLSNPATVLLLHIANASVGALPAVSQQPDVLVRLNAKHLTPEVTKYVAEVGIRKEVTADAGDTLGNIIETHCGRRDLNYLKYLETTRADFPVIKGDFTFESRIESKSTLKLPYCVQIPADERLPKAWWPADLADLKGRKMRTVPGTDVIDTRPTFTSVYSPSVTNPSNKPKYGFEPYYEFGGFDYGPGFATVKRAQPAPAAKRYEGWTAIPLPKGTNSSEVSTRLSAMWPHDGAERKPEVGTVNTDVELLSTIPPQEDECPSPNKGMSEYPIDAAALIHVLGLNMEHRGTKFRSADIIIADTGLLKVPSSIFPESAFGQYGIRANRLSLIMSTPGYAHAAHGTYVASAALGGAYFRRFLALLDFPIHIKPINVIRDQLGTVDELKLNKVIDSGREETLVINMSISRHGEINGLRSILEAQRNALFVVAAGNAPKRIAGAHPASLGGDFPNLIVVAGLDSEGGFSPHSSWSASNVEVAAFGCRVPVYGAELQPGSDQYTIEAVSGTSIASPLVAFTAALLLNHNVISPLEVKKRILASSDFDPALEGKVRHNLKLNTIRAVSVYHDVVAVGLANSTRSITGRFTAGDRLLPLCEGKDSRGRERGGLKSLTVYSKDRQRRIFYMFEYDMKKPLDVGDCPLDDELAAHKLTIKDAITGKEESVTIGELRNLTFADRIR